MKAVQFSEYGEPDVLHVAEVEEPHAGPGQIRIAVRAAGRQPDRLEGPRGDVGRAQPHAPADDARDAAGVVDEVGAGVDGVAVGDEVFGFAIGGGAAEHALLAHCARKPPELSLGGGGGPPSRSRPRRALDLLGVGEGQTLLVTGAAGGVGTAAVQLARLAARASSAPPASATTTSCARSAPSRRRTATASSSGSARSRRTASTARSTLPAGARCRT